MTAATPFQHVRAKLRLRHVPFDGGKLLEFCGAMHALAFDEDRWYWWADTFPEAMGREIGAADLRGLPTAALYGPGEN